MNNPSNSIPHDYYHTDINIFETDSYNSFPLRANISHSTMFTRNPSTDVVTPDSYANLSYAYIISNEGTYHRASISIMGNEMMKLHAVLTTGRIMNQVFHPIKRPIQHPNLLSVLTEPINDNDKRVSENDNNVSNQSPVILSDDYDVVFNHDEKVLVISLDMTKNEVIELVSLYRTPHDELESIHKQLMALDKFNAPLISYVKCINQVYSLLELLSIDQQKVVETVRMGRWRNSTYPDSANDYTEMDAARTDETMSIFYRFYPIEIHGPLTNQLTPDDLGAIINVYIFLVERQMSELATEFINKVITYPSVAPIIHSIDSISQSVDISKLESKPFDYCVSFEAIKKALVVLFQEEQRVVVGSIGYPNKPEEPTTQEKVNDNEDSESDDDDDSYEEDEEVMDHKKDELREEKEVVTNEIIYDSKNIGSLISLAISSPDSQNNNDNNAIVEKSGEDNSLVTESSLFIFDLQTAYNISPSGTIRSNAWEVLDYYLGGVLDSLDLSDSYITGSSFCATILDHPFHKTMRYQDIIDLYYPATYHVGNDSFNSIIKLINRSIDDKNTRFMDIYEILWSHINSHQQHYGMPRNNRQSNYDLSKFSKDKVIKHFELREIPGADVDIAVNPSLTTTEFKQVARKHYLSLLAYWPAATFTETTRDNGTLLYTVKGGHREVQIYQASKQHIMTHHVGMVRGYITGNGESRDAYMSTSCLLSAINGQSTNYYYFAGKKSKCMDVVVKYARRGWGIPSYTHSRLKDGIRIATYSLYGVAFEDLPQQFFVKGLTNLHTMLQYRRNKDALSVRSIDVKYDDDGTYHKRRNIYLPMKKDVDMRVIDPSKEDEKAKKSQDRRRETDEVMQRAFRGCAPHANISTSSDRSHSGVTICNRVKYDDLSYATYKKIKDDEDRSMESMGINRTTINRIYNRVPLTPPIPMIPGLAIPQPIPQPVGQVPRVLPAQQLPVVGIHSAIPRVTVHPMPTVGSLPGIPSVSSHSSTANSDNEKGSLVSRSPSTVRRFHSPPSSPKRSTSPQRWEPQPTSPISTLNKCQRIILSEGEVHVLCLDPVQGNGIFCSEHI